VQWLTMMHSQKVAERLRRKKWFFPKNAKYVFVATNVS